MPTPAQKLALPHSHALRRIARMDFVWSVQRPVGLGQDNVIEDVKLVQRMLAYGWANAQGGGAQNFAIRPTGVLSPADAFWIFHLQTVHRHYRGKPDGIVSPLPLTQHHEHFALGILNNLCFNDSTVKDGGASFEAGTFF